LILSLLIKREFATNASIAAAFNGGSYVNRASRFFGTGLKIDRVQVLYKYL